jgi:hypothetical protein
MAVEAYMQYSHKTWVLNWPGQVLVVLGIIHWTVDVMQVSDTLLN